MKQKLFFILLFILSLVLRAFFGMRTEFNVDHLRIYNLGYDLYYYHIIPAYGAPVVYTETKLLGAFQGFLAAIGLFFSKGNPYGIIYFVQLYNAFACLIIYFIYKNLFPNFNKYYLFVFIIFLPLNFMVSSAWNPAFIPLLSTCYLYGIVRILNSKTDFYSYFLILFPHILIFQLNLQFMILLSLTMLMFCLKIIPIPKLRYMLLSQIPGLIFLIPTFIDSFKTHKNVTENIISTPGLLKNIQFHPERISDFFHIIFKFISFGTGEIFRIGYYPFRNYILWPIFIFALAINASLVFVGVLFYCRKETWNIKFYLQKLFKNSATTHSRPESQSLTVLQKFDFIVLMIPIITTILFLFSVIKMKFHTIWILFPFSFYPIFRMISLRFGSDFSVQTLKMSSLGRWLSNVLRLKAYIFVAFMISTLICSYVETDKYPTQFIRQYNKAKEICAYKVTNPQKYESCVQNPSVNMQLVIIPNCRYFDNSNTHLSQSVVR